jgi:hypothetical protein
MQHPKIHAGVQWALSCRTCYLEKAQESNLTCCVCTVALCRYTFEEAETTFTTQTLSASWESFTDPESPIKVYEVVILEEVGVGDAAAFAGHIISCPQVAVDPVSSAQPAPVSSWANAAIFPCLTFLSICPHASMPAKRMCLVVKG